jgi:TonB-linked SusC/RagA family outer membrane protein
MKATMMILMLVVSISYGNNSNAQSKVSIKVKNATLIELLEQIENQSNVGFVFDTKELDLEKRYSIHQSNIHVIDLLDNILEKDKYLLREVGDNIIIKKLLIAPTTESQNQQKHTVTGKVTDATGEPLPGVNVYEKIQPQNGVITGVDGAYQIEVSSEDVILVFSYIGFESQEIHTTGRALLDITLVEETTGLNEVVVTALGISKETKKLGFSFQKVDGEELLASGRDPNIANKLAGRVAGLQINSNAAIGGSTRIVLRGESSLSKGGNTPLIVVNGVPVDNNVSTSGSIDWGSAISDINPDDIESINVLKGPVAAALYGSRAGNGAIVVVTKTAQKNSGTSVSFSSSLMFDEILKYPDTYQYKYGSGRPNGTAKSYNPSDFSYNPGVYDEAWSDTPYDPNLLVEWWWSETSSGARAGDTELIQGVSVKSPYVSNGMNNYEQYYETGLNFTNSVSVSSGGEKHNFRISYTNMDQKGVAPGTDLKRQNFSVSAGGEISKKLRVSTNVNYVNISSDNRPDNSWGQNRIGYLLAWMAPGTHLDKLEEYWQRGLEGQAQIGWRGQSHNNPYFVAHEVLRGLNKDRLFGNTAATYSFNKYLKLIARFGMDLTSQLITERNGFGSFKQNPEYYENRDNKLETNTDFLLTYDRELTEKWDLSASVGGNLLHINNRYVSNRAKNLVSPGIYTLTNAEISNRSVGQGFYEKKVNSLYAVTTLSYANAITLDVTARNDWSSTLPKENRSYFYPSASLGFLLPELIPALPNAISFLKLRLAAAQVGKDTSPYQGQNLFHTSNYGGVVGYYTGSGLSNPELKPEKTTSYEVGFDSKFFGNRLGLDFTYYQSNNINQVLGAALPISSGYGSRTINAGKIENKGIEIVLTGTPLRTNDFSWDIMANFGKNETTVVELAEGLTRKYIGGNAGGDLEIISEVGKSVFGIYGKKHLTVDDPDSPHFGREIYDSNGLVVLTAKNEYLGDANPEWILGLTNNFTYKNFRLGILLDYRHGGKVYSGITNVMYRGGYNTETVKWREEGVIGDGVVSDGNGGYTENTTMLIGADIKNKWIGNYRRARDKFLYDGSYLKVRDVSLSYALPNSLLSKTPFSGVNVALVGRNLFVFSDVPNQDPDVYLEGVPGNSGSYYIPTTRSYGLNLNINF